MLIQRELADKPVELGAQYSRMAGYGFKKGYFPPKAYTYTNCKREERRVKKEEYKRKLEQNRNGEKNEWPSV